MVETTELVSTGVEVVASVGVVVDGASVVVVGGAVVGDVVVDCESTLYTSESRC